MVVLFLNRDAHGAGGTLDHAHDGLDIGGVDIGLLDLGDLADLLLGELANLVAVGAAGGGLQVQLLLDEREPAASW